MKHRIGLTSGFASRAGYQPKHCFWDQTNKMSPLHRVENYHVYKAGFNCAKKNMYNF